MSERDPFARYRDRLAALGFRPSRRWGQNFLLDPTLHAFIADRAELAADELAVEVGVGLGFLTRELARRAGDVLGIEVDPKLAAIARDELSGLAHVEIVEGDVMDGPDGLHAAFVAALVARSSARRWKLVANLPYKVSGPFLGEVTGLPELPVRAVCLVQEELAERLCAAPGSKEFGSLTAVVQGAFTARIVRRVGAQVFRPRPNVGSAILVLERREAGMGTVGWPVPARQAYRRFVRGLFQQRRKRLRSQWPRALAEAGLGAAACPEALAERRPDALEPLPLAEVWRSQCVDAEFWC